jgi:hypothetical protein
VLELAASVGTCPVLVAGPVLEELPGPVLPPLLLALLVLSTPLPVIDKLALNEPSVVWPDSVQPTSPITINASVALVCP